MPETNQNQPNVVESVIEQLVQARSNTVMSQEEVASVRAWAIETVGNYINRALVMALDDEQLDELNQKIDAGASDEDLEQFFLTAGIDYRPILEQALQELLQQNGVTGGQN